MIFVAKLGWTSIFWVMVLALNLPNFIWLQDTSDLLANTGAFVERLLIALLLSALGLALFSQPRRAWSILWVLCLWWLPLAVGVRIISGTPITATLIATVAATSPTELYNLLSAISWSWVIFFIIWNLFCYGFWCYLSCYFKNSVANQNLVCWSWSFRGKVWFFSLSLLILPYLILPNSPSISGTQSRISLIEDVQTLSSSLSSVNIDIFSKADQRIGNVAYLPDIFPYELPWAVMQYYKARQAVNTIYAHLKNLDPNYTLTATQAKAEVIVLVIGESSTRNAWHWFNVQAPATTPYLEARATQGEHLFRFERILAQTTATRQAVPSILTAQPLVWPNGVVNPQATRSIVSVAAQAGYATAWFSNQAAIGTYDGIIASYAKEAGTIAFLNPSNFSEQGNLDEVLLPVLHHHLDKYPKAFIVLHTMGSHFDYKHRYPKGFGPFPENKNLRETYFNSIAYTDYILNQIISILANDGRRSALIYTSDHGETIPEGQCRTGAANRTTHDAYEVPAFVWLSAAYAREYPEIPTVLKSNQNQPYTVAAIHQTLLDLMRAEVSTEKTQPLQKSIQDTKKQSFLHPSIIFSIKNTENKGGEDSSQILPPWFIKYQAALEKNPCLMLLQNLNLGN